MEAFPLNPALFAALFAEVSACWPKEACGVILGPRGEPGRQRFVRFENTQDRLHRIDPAHHPRDARTAYAMDPLLLTRTLQAAEAAGEELIAVVHSHPDYPSYFSETDRAAASPFGSPTFPAALQIVVSVYSREIRDIKGFAWDGVEWAEQALAGVPALPGPPDGAAPMGYSTP